MRLAASGGRFAQVKLYSTVGRVYHRLCEPHMGVAHGQRDSGNVTSSTPPPPTKNPKVLRLSGLSPDQSIYSLQFLRNTAYTPTSCLIQLSTRKRALLPRPENDLAKGRERFPLLFYFIRPVNRHSQIFTRFSAGPAFNQPSGTKVV